MNPFLLNNYLGPDYFCGRNEETEILLKNINNNSNTAVFSQRRIGKTANKILEKEYVPFIKNTFQPYSQNFIKNYDRGRLQH